LNPDSNPPGISTAGATSQSLPPFPAAFHIMSPADTSSSPSPDTPLTAANGSHGQSPAKSAAARKVRSSSALSSGRGAMTR
jgi:hypothetical protein